MRARRIQEAFSPAQNDFQTLRADTGRSVSGKGLVMISVVFISKMGCSDLGTAAVTKPAPDLRAAAAAK